MITPSKFVGSFHILWIYSLAANTHLLKSFLIFPKHDWGVDGRALEVMACFGAIPRNSKGKRRLLCAFVLHDFPLGILLTRGELANVLGDMTVTTTRLVFKSAAHGRHSGRTSHSES